MKTWLIDTGPIVAYLDARDSEHQRVADVLEDFKGQLVTTSAVLTECMHFVSAHVDGPTALLEFLIAGRVLVRECIGPEQLGRAVELMKKYHDTPMDFADATLVCLAEAMGTNHICTLDRRGFTIYRMARNKRFILVP